MLSRLADSLLPALGRLTVTADTDAALAPGSIVVSNHTSLADPAAVLASLRRVGVEPAVMAAAGPWRIPRLGRMLAREGPIPVHRDDHRASRRLGLAAAALGEGRPVLVYGEGRLPRRTDPAAAAPAAFRSGLARLAEYTGAPVVPLGQAGARRITSGNTVKQIAGLVTTPLRRPTVHVHIGAPIRLTGDRATRIAQAHGTVTAAWRTAAERLGEPAGPPSRHG